MTTEAFISYSHTDDSRRERLHKHLITLRRDGLLQAWSDHEILAGDRLTKKIDAAIDKSGSFIALLGSDYQASNYCYVFAPHADDGSFNGWLTVKADEYHLYLQGTIDRFGIHGDKTYSAEEAADALWNAFMQQAGLEFED